MAFCNNFPDLIYNYQFQFARFEVEIILTTTSGLFILSFKKTPAICLDLV